MRSDSQKERSQKPYLLLVLGIVISAWGMLEIMKNGFSLAERGNPEQLEGGLYPLLLVIGVAVAAYGGIERWLNRK